MHCPLGDDRTLGSDSIARECAPRLCGGAHRFGAEDAGGKLQLLSGCMHTYDAGEVGSPQEGQEMHAGAPRRP